MEDRPQLSWGVRKPTGLECEGELPTAELRLPAEVLACATGRGNEYAWRRHDLPMVFAAAEAAGLVILGGQVQFRVPNGTCELYWYDFGSSERRAGESRQEWIKRARQETEVALNRVPSSERLIAEALASFEFLRQKAHEGVSIGESLCFVCDFSDSE